MDNCRVSRSAATGVSSAGLSTNGVAIRRRATFERCDCEKTAPIHTHSKRVRYHNLNDGDVVTIGQHELLYIDERARHRHSTDQQHGATTVLNDRHSDR